MFVETVLRQKVISKNIYIETFDRFWFQVPYFNILDLFFFTQSKRNYRWKIKTVVPFLPRTLKLHGPCVIDKTIVQPSRMK